MGATLGGSSRESTEVAWRSLLMARGSSVPETASVALRWGLFEHSRRCRIVVPLVFRGFGCEIAARRAYRGSDGPDPPFR